MLYYIGIIIWYVSLSNIMSNKNQDTQLEKDINTPLNVIANSSRFNISTSIFNNMEIGCNPIIESISKLLTFMGERDNTIST